MRRLTLEMRRLFRLFSAVLALGLIAIGPTKAQAQDFSLPLVCDGRIFMSLQNSNLVVDGVTYNTVGLFELIQDPVDLSYESVPITPPSGSNYNSTAYNIQDGYLYAGFNNKIWRIKSDGTLELFGTPGGSFRSGYVGDIDDNNKYYLQSGNANNLHVVDLDNPNTYTVLSVRVNGQPTSLRGADIAFNPRDGFLYIKSRNDTILKINRDTGAATELNAVSSSPDGGAGGAWFDAAGYFYNYFNAGFIYRYDIENPNQDGTIPTTFFSNAFNVRTNDGALCAYRPTITKTVSPNPGTPGQPVTYTFTIFNVLPVEINSRLDDSISNFTGATWDSAITNCSAESLSGTDETAAYCTSLTTELSESDTFLKIRNLKIPARGKLQFDLTVATSAASTPDSICNQAELRNIRPDGADYDDRFEDLILKSDDPGQSGREDPTCHSFGTLEMSCSLSDNTGGEFTPGQTSVITMRLENTGSAKAAQITIDEILASGARINASTFSPDEIQCNAIGNNSDTTCGSQIVAADRMSYSLRDLGVSAASGGTAGALELKFPIAFDTNNSTANYVFSPTLAIGGENFDDLCGEYSLASDPVADLSAIKSSFTNQAALNANIAQNYYTPGEETIYRVRVQNAGPSNVTDATWTDDLPSNFNYSSFDFECDCLNAGSCTASAGAANASNTIAGSLNLPADCSIDLLFTGIFDTAPN